VVVGTTLRSLPEQVIQVCEYPPGGGPVAAVAAVSGCVGAPLVVVLACDMPFVTAAVVHRLVEAASGRDRLERERCGGRADAAMLVDGAGRRQYLAAAYRTRSLRAALTRVGPPNGTAMRRLVDGLTVTEVATDPEVTLDCDTWADVERSRDAAERPRDMAERSPDTAERARDTAERSPDAMEGR
jgi:molybdopterin-guanine dinucleotide biosynthesis protein A